MKNLLASIALTFLVCGLYSQFHLVDTITSSFSGTTFGGHGILIDYENDGDLDIMDFTNTLFLNDGQGQFQISNIQMQNTYFGGIFPGAKAFDLDGDGYDDILNLHRNPAPNWFHNQYFFGISGTFEEEWVSFWNTPQNDFVAENSNEYLLLDSPGPTDLLTYYGDGTIRKLSGVSTFQMDTSFVNEEILIDTGSPWLSGVKILQADLTGDGNEEVITIGDGGLGYYNYHWSSGLSNFQLLKSNAYSLGDLEVNDLDQDGDLDILALLHYGELHFIENLGSGTFAPSVLIMDLDVNMLGAFVQGELIDLDHDGDDDLILDIPANQSVDVYLNDGALGFDSLFQIPIGQGDMTSVADLDGDSYDDIIVFSIDPNTLNNVGLFYKNLITLSNRMEGTVYFDENQNGVLDASETGVEGITLSVSPLDSYFMGISAGEYSIAASFGTHDLSLSFNDTIWTQTSSPISYSVDFTGTDSTVQDLDFGVYPLITDFAADLDISSSFPRCVGTIHHWISAVNSGNPLLSGSLVYTLDNNLQFLSSDVPPDSVVGNSYYFGFSSLLYVTEQIHIQLSSDILTGDVSTTVEFLDDSGALISSTTLDQTVSCSYDPNDKTELNGWTDDGLILSGDVLEYQIRFQNTGTDTAFTVTIEDQLSEHLDHSSFDLISLSHEATVSVDNSGMLRAVFDNILLPDSNVNEVESHGFLKFRIASLSGLPAETLIENTAAIIFDVNVPVITNTTVNTIYDCDSLGLFHPASTLGAICPEDIFHIAVQGWLAESFEWFMNDEPYPISTNSVTIPNQAPGIYDVDIIVTNPLCEVTRSTTVEVYESPMASIAISLGGEFMICESDNAVEFQWYLDDVLIDGATAQTYFPAPGEEGLFTVWVTDANGCTNLSESVLFTPSGVKELRKIDAVISPNPSSGIFTLNFDHESQVRLRIVNILGEEVFQQENYRSAQPIDLKGLGAGIYQVSLEQEGEKLYSSPLLLK